jgi:hypothetical protein
MAYTKDGFLPEKKAKELVEEYEKLLKRYTRTLGSEQAAHAAADHYVQIKQEIVYKKMDNEITHVVAQERLKDEIGRKAAIFAREKGDAKKWGKWAFGNPQARATREFLQKVFVRHQSLERMAHAMIGDIVEKYRSKKAGFSQDVAGFVDVVREMCEQNTGSAAAKGQGAALREVFDTLHGMLRASGAIIGKIDNYFPQMHTPELIGRVKPEEWINFLLPLLDRNRMVDPATALPMNDAKLMEIMKLDHESFKTNGLSDVAAGRADINTRQSAARFYHFKNIEAFLEYNNRFGVQDQGLFSAVMHHIGSMTRDIALMQQMGPKPNAISRDLLQQMEIAKASPAAMNAVRGMYSTLAGMNSYNGTLPTWYKAIAGWINLKRSAYLGSAPISALSDSFFIGTAARMNGLSSVNVMKRYFSLLNPANEADRRIARRNMFIASAASGMSLQGARFSDDLGKGGITGFLAGVTNRASGLGVITDSGRHAIAMEMAGHLAEMRAQGKGFNDIDPTLRKAAELYGIDENDWDRAMKSKPSYIDEVDSEFLFPEDIASLGQDGLETSVKFSDWMTEMSSIALNEPGLLTRSITTGAIVGDARPGTLNRIMFANLFFAKSFPVTVMINHLIPAFRDAAQGRGQKLAQIAIGSAVFGAFAMQMRQIVSGKDPRDMADPKFWTAAMLQGGGLGLFGDFMFADYNRFGASMGASLAGPVVGSLESLIKIGDLDSLGTDADMNKMLADTWKVVNREIPVIRLWYSRLFVERLLLDQIEKAADPSYSSRMRRVEKRMKKQTGQGWWWTPGTTTPTRAPDLTTVAGS